MDFLSENNVKSKKAEKNFKKGLSSYKMKMRRKKEESLRLFNAKNSVKPSHLPKVAKGRRTLFWELWVLCSTAAAGGRGESSLTNSDGTDDGATDRRVAGERWQILTSALIDWPRDSALRHNLPDQQAPWGSGSVVLGPRPPTGVGESLPSRPGTSRRRSALRRSRATSPSNPARPKLPGGDTGRTAEKARDSRF